MKYLLVFGMPEMIIIMLLAVISVFVGVVYFILRKLLK